MQHGFLPLPKSVHAEYIKANTDIFDFELTDDEMKKLDGLRGVTRLATDPDMKLSAYLAYKGSVTVNGVSLTINDVEDTPVGTRISINLIPHTVEVTTLKHLKPQSWVNLEIDTIARYVERMMSLKNDDGLF